MELDEKFIDVIVKRYIKYKGSSEDCYLIRNGERISVETIEDFQNLTL
jgi:hypothetical protein